MLHVRPATVLRVLLVVSVGMIALFVGTQLFHDQISLLKLGHLTRFFDADGEQTVPAWFSSGMLLLSAALFGLIAMGQGQARAGGARYWWGLAAIFLLMSIDEAVSIHETLNQLRDNLQVGGILYFAWVVPASALLLAFGAVYFRFWLGLPARTRWLLALSAGIYLGGALVMELVGGPIYEASRESTRLYLLVLAVEELLEMLGLSALIYTLLAHIRDNQPATMIVFAPAGVAEAAQAPTAEPSRVRPGGSTATAD